MEIDPSMSSVGVLNFILLFISCYVHANVSGPIYFFLFHFCIFLVLSTVILEGLGRSLEPNLNLIEFAIPFLVNGYSIKSENLD